MSQNKKTIRKNFREAVFRRDAHRCKVCGAQSDTLDAHHITDRNEMPNGGYVQENGIALCPDCHLKAEQYHITQKQSFAPNFHPDDLYALIGSSFEAAWQASAGGFNEY